MNEVIKTIFERRAVRKYKDKPVSKEIIEQLLNAGRMAGAPVIIFITAPKENEWAGLDSGMCWQNSMLAAKSFGLESCPIGFGKFIEKTKYYSKLNIPSTGRIHPAIIIGYGDESPEIHERIKNNAFYK
jgi:nitroreductase